MCECGEGVCECGKVCVYEVLIANLCERYEGRRNIVFAVSFNPLYPFVTFNPCFHMSHLTPCIHVTFNACFACLIYFVTLNPCLF